MSQSDAIRDKVLEAQADGFKRSDMWLEMHFSALDELMVEAANNSNRLLFGVDRPSNFEGVRIIEGADFEGWKLGTGPRHQEFAEDTE